jgi:hypothetical protein
MVKKLYSVILSLIMLLSCNVTCFALAAGGTEIQPYYTYTESVNTMLKISNGTATCVSSILGKTGTTKVKITMTLEKKVLFWWSEKETWTQTFNSSRGTLSKTYSGADSGTYRITAEYIAYGSSGSEIINDTSAEIKA